jgi:hypothetical protein
MQKEREGGGKGTNRLVIRDRAARSAEGEQGGMPCRCLETGDPTPEASRRTGHRGWYRAGGAGGGGRGRKGS